MSTDPTSFLCLLLIFTEGPQYLQQAEQWRIQTGVELCEALHSGHRSGSLLPKQGKIITDCS